MHPLPKSLVYHSTHFLTSWLICRRDWLKHCLMIWVMYCGVEYWLTCLWIHKISLQASCHWVMHYTLANIFIRLWNWLFTKDKPVRRSRGIEVRSQPAFDECFAGNYIFMAKINPEILSTAVLFQFSAAEGFITDWLFITSHFRQLCFPWKSESMHNDDWLCSV